MRVSPSPSPSPNPNQLERAQRAVAPQGEAQRGGRGLGQRDACDAELAQLAQAGRGGERAREQREALRAPD